MTALLLEIFLFLFKATCELRLVSYSPQNASRSLSNKAFCAYMYFKYNSKSMGYLHLYCTPNGSSTTDDASCHVKSSKTVITYTHKLQCVQPPTNIAVLLFCVQVCMRTKLGAPTVALHPKWLLYYRRMHLFWRIKWGNTLKLLSVTYSVHYTQCTLHTVYTKCRYINNILQTGNLHIPYFLK